MERLTFRNNLGNATSNINPRENYMEFVNRLAEYEDANEPRPIEEWHEDYGDCLFWKLPIEEPPYCGSPLDSGFTDDYYTHFTRLIMPLGD
jgi:hypothetical protein